ncbi:MAG: hypothetical protein ACXWUN_09370, partial [Allosphingosinicella sp.]
MTKLYLLSLYAFLPAAGFFVEAFFFDVSISPAVGSDLTGASALALAAGFFASVLAGFASSTFGAASAASSP